jgi:hypothetical protein
MTGVFLICVLVAAGAGYGGYLLGRLSMRYEVADDQKRASETWKLASSLLRATNEALREQAKSAQEKAAASLPYKEGKPAEKTVSLSVGSAQRESEP